MQYNRLDDGTLQELPMKSVDTGSGLERVAALSQGKTSVMDIDIFTNIKNHILSCASIAKKENEFSLDEKESTNVIADHIRMLCFTLADGVSFSNEGRGYVLRRVLRRAVRHAHRLNPKWPKEQSFLKEIVVSVVRELGEFYPELTSNQKRIEQAIADEELRFSATLEKGLEYFNHFIQNAKTKNQNYLSGEAIFILHDRYGFPSDLTQVLCEEIGFKADLTGFVSHMELQKEKSRNEAKFYQSEEDDSSWFIIHSSLDLNLCKKFNGYGIQNSHRLLHGSEVFEQKLDYSHIKQIRQLKNGAWEMIIALTPFYPEGGGQVSDTGWLVVDTDENPVEFAIVNVQKTSRGIVHVLKCDNEPLGSYNAPERLTKLFHAKNNYTLFLNLTNRLATSRNHTATHLLHRALQVTLGENVRQAGSLVTPQGLRFDFSHGKALSVEELRNIEKTVNSQILKNTQTLCHEDIPLSQAKKMGAMAMFDEKYEDYVRVLEIPGYSTELCGGTHVSSTGSIGLFKILSETSVTSGVRRIEALTGDGIIDYVSSLKSQVHSYSDYLKCPESEIYNRIAQLKENNKFLESNIHQLQLRLMNENLKELINKKIYCGNETYLICSFVEIQSAKELDILCDKIKEKHNFIALLAAKIDDKISIICGAHPQVLKSKQGFSAGIIVKELCQALEGKGGGRPDYAKGSAPFAEKIFSLLEKTAQKLEKIKES
ncbi:MAG: alanine--tRNA ligase [Silvanigrellaceae bacterium]|nr:alanine--tRNA ligase [Silvanigrellaceae bacterium]